MKTTIEVAGYASDIFMSGGDWSLLNPAMLV